MLQLQVETAMFELAAQDGDIKVGPDEHYELV